QPSHHEVVCIIRPFILRRGIVMLRTMYGVAFARVGFVVLLALLASACERTSETSSSTSAPPMTTAAANAAWPRFVEDFIEAYFVAHPTFAVSAGRHEFDGRLPDWSSEGI